jgi:hypothetical protein
MDTTSKTADIVILTTAVDRPELHTPIFENYVRYVGNYNVQWVITINNISNQVEQTEHNLRKILDKYDVHIKTFDTGGSRVDWYNSVKYCINYAYELKPNIGYFWLEDDWSVNHGTLSEDVSLLSHTNCHVSLANRNEVSFNPALWDTVAFEHLMYNSINNPDTALGKRYVDGLNTNPERICCPFPEATKFVNKLISVNRFADAGRHWQTQTVKCRTFSIK